MKNVTCLKLLIYRSTAPEKLGTMKNISLFGSFEFPQTGPYAGGLVMRSLAGAGKTSEKTQAQLWAMSARINPIAGARGATTAEEMPGVVGNTVLQTPDEIYSVRYIQHSSDAAHPVSGQPATPHHLTQILKAGYGLKKPSKKRVVFTQRLKEVMLEFYNMQAISKRKANSDAIATMVERGIQPLKESQVKSWWSSHNQESKKEMKRMSEWGNATGDWQPRKQKSSTLSGACTHHTAARKQE